MNEKNIAHFPTKPRVTQRGDQAHLKTHAVTDLAQQKNTSYGALSAPKSISQHTVLTLFFLCVYLKNLVKHII